MQKPCFLGEKNKPDQGEKNKPYQRSCIFLKLPFSLLMFSNENYIAKLRKLCEEIVSTDEHDFQNQPFTNVLQNRCS